MAFAFYSILPNRLDIVWRLALAFGAFPGLCMIYFRVKMEETSRFAASNQPAAISITSMHTHTHPLSSSTYHAHPLSPSTYHATSTHPEQPTTLLLSDMEPRGPFHRLKLFFYSLWQSHKVFSYSFFLLFHPN